MRSVLAAILLCGLACPPAAAESIAGVECKDIRNLSWPERRYWIWRLGLSAADIQAIRKRCRVRR